MSGTNRIMELRKIRDLGKITNSWWLSLDIESIHAFGPASAPRIEACGSAKPKAILSRGIPFWRNALRRSLGRGEAAIK